MPPAPSGYVNMLRTTTETMSAAIAGADSITTNPFDIAYKESDSFGYRISRNQQLLLKEESYMDKIVDPAAGSYYIENLTDSIAQYAWQLFMDVEEHGGFAEAIREGFVQAEVEKTAQQRDMDIATRKTTILGTNQYPNLLEKMGDKITKDTQCCPKCACHEGEAEFKPLRHSPTATSPCARLAPVFFFFFFAWPATRFRTMPVSRVPKRA